MPAKKKLKPNPSSELPSALVAGAAGFVGSHLCESLLLQNCRVYGFDNWLTGKKENISQLKNQPNFVFIEHDLSQPINSPPQVDYIFHLAGLEPYLNQQKDLSLETLLVNSLGTRELLEIARKQGAKFLLASSIDIFSGQVSLSSLAEYFGSNPEKQEKYSHQEAKRFAEALVFEYLDRFKINARIIRLAQIYGPRQNLNVDHSLARILLNFKSNQPLKIFGQGLETLYLTYISDVIYGLTKAMFSQSSQGQIYTLVNPEKTTTLSLAYKLKALYPEKKLKIEFVPGEEVGPPPTLSESILASQAELNWSPKITLEEGLVKTINWLSGEKIEPVSETAFLEESLPREELSPEKLGLKPAPVPRQPNQPPKPVFKLKINFPRLKLTLPQLKPPQLKISLTPKPRQLSRRLKISLFILIGGLLYLFIPVILLLIFSIRGLSYLNSAAAIENLNQLDKLVSLTVKADKNINFSRQLLRQSSPVLSLLGGRDLTNSFDQLLFIGTKLSQGAVHLSRVGESARILFQIIFHHQEGNLTQALKDIRLNLDQAYSEFSFVESELQAGREQGSRLTDQLAAKLQQLSRQLPQLRRQINQLRKVLPIVPSFIAQDTKKTYLLLFQNSAEIRPTGGFIGSYGLLTFDKGKLLDFSVEDIYSADGQLKGYVQPPKPLEKYLGQNTWFFRDSNWDPDFVISAQRAEWFLNKTTNRNVDGVIAVNLPVAKEMLKATGPLVLTDFNEEVTAENLFERAEYHSEIDFFPGSTQKKDFLGALAREIFVKLKNSSSAEMVKFIQALETSLTQKQLLIYLHDPDSQKIVTEQNWGGAIFSPDLTHPDKLPVTTDYSYLVEANLGINKANYFLNRSIEQQLTILKTKEILAITTINYQNQSPADTWPGGVYRSYLRHYLPKGASIISVKVGESKLSSTELDLETVNDKLVLGFSVTVPVKNSLKVEITYRLPSPLQFSNRQGRLAVVVPKQPGILNDQLKVLINYPSYLSVSNLFPRGQASPQVVSFESDLTTDRYFYIDFIER